MHPINLLVPNDEFPLVSYIRQFYPLMQTTKVDKGVDALIKDAKLERVPFQFLTDKFLECYALFNTLNYRLRHEIDAYMYNEVMAKMINMPSIHELINNKGALAPYLIAPPGYLYAWYVLQGNASFRLKGRLANNVPQVAAGEEFRNAHYSLKWLLDTIAWRFAGNNFGTRSGGWGGVSYSEIIKGHAATDFITIEAIMSYMTDSFGRSSLKTKFHEIYRTPPARTAAEVTKFDIFVWSKIFELQKDIHKATNNNTKYSANCVVAYGLFLSFILYASIITRGQEYTCISKQLVDRPALTRKHVLQLNDVLPDLLSKLGITASSSITLRTNVKAMTFPILKEENLGQKVQNILADFKIGVRSRGLMTTDFVDPTPTSTITATKKKGVSWSVMVHTALHKMGLLSLGQGDERYLNILLSFLSDKIVIMLSGLPKEDQVDVLHTLTRLINESSLSPTYNSIIKTVEDALFDTDRGQD